MKHIDLFSGIGGFSLAAHWAGFRTVVFCEKDEFCQRVLEARFGGIIADSERMRELQSKGGIGTQRGRIGDIPVIPDIRDFDGTKWRGATLLTGGFPCQPFSAAGKRRGKEDDRHLWPEMLRVISEAKPRWVVGENVAGIINMELDTVLADLEGEGYEVGTVVIPACAKNAPHRRDRVWIIANAKKPGRGGILQRGWEQEGVWRKGSNRDAPDSRCLGWGEGATGRNQSSSTFGRYNENAASWQIPWLEVATRFCGIPHGLPPWIHRHRVKRLKALGNSIVPQVAYEIMREIKCAETKKKEVI